MSRAAAGVVLSAALLCGSCATGRVSEAPQGDRTGHGHAAEERGPLRPDRAWFVRQRMSSGGPIPARARERALENRRRRLSSQTVQAPGLWTFAGPTNIGGRLTSLALDPANPDHLWAGAAAGGVFESTNRGDTWAPVFDGQPLLPVGAVASHPFDSNIVYAGTGEANGAGYSYDGDGVYRTTNGGVSWQHMGLTGTRRIGRIAIDPMNPQRIFVAAAGGVYVPDTERGVYRSIDGGSSWTQVLFVSTTAGAIDVAIDPANPSRIYAAIWQHYSTDVEWVAGGLDSGIWKSEDGGDTWARITSGLPPSSTTIGRIGLAVAPSKPATVYALYLDDPGYLIGVYKSINAGVDWFRVDTPGGGQEAAFGGAGYYFGQIRVDPTDDRLVYLLDVYWARSTDGGATFITVNSGLHVDHHDLVILPGRLYMANDGGFYTSTNGGGTWTQASWLPITQFYDLGINPVNSVVRFGGAQDNGSIRTKSGGLSNWTSVYGGDGEQCEVDPIDTQRVYCESQFGGIVRSTNGGNSFTRAVTGISAAEQRNWNAPITHDPVTTQRLYTGTFRVYRSVDGAQSWSPISGDLTNGPPPHLQPVGRGAGASHLASTVEATITTIAVSTLDTNVIWAGTDDGNIWVTSNAGGQWARVDIPGRSEWVTRLEADPFLAGEAFATFSGYRNGSPLPRIFRTMNYGATWTDISNGLPDVPLNCVSADPAAQSRGRLFVCSDVGVYVTDNYGLTWSALGTGMPQVVVHDLDLINASRELFAATHARSMFRYNLNQLGPADADGDGVDNLADCNATDAGSFALPGEVGGLNLEADRMTLSWDSAAPAAGTGTTHQVLRGPIAALPVGGGGAGAGESCLSAGTPAASFVDTGAPPPGAGFWYLVRAVNSCGEGSYGTTSAGQTRVSATCG